MVPPQRTFNPPTTTLADPACCCPACAGLECLDRTRFFAGQLLTEADLNNEQSYLLAKNRLHNRYLHGWGVVCGLQVVCSECEGWVTVKPGYAIDPCGNDIIVCQEQSFNLCKAIQECCTPAKTSNCSPLRYTPSPTCQDQTQTWCITIQYQEQPGRKITPLQNAPSRQTNADCAPKGKNNGGNGGNCGCAPVSCGCPQLPTTAAKPLPSGACEPTRIIEGFKLGIMCDPPAQEEGPVPGSGRYQLEQCLAGLKQLISQNPYPSGIANTNPRPSYQQAYQAICNYRQMVLNALSSSFVTHCQLEIQLAGISIPPPPNDGSTGDPTQLQTALNAIIVVIVIAARDCICTSLLPACAPDPCDNRLILACVTVQDCQIINICHFGVGRRQVITFPVLEYWLSLIGFDIIWSDLGKILGLLCCGEYKQGDSFYPNYSYRDNLTTAGISRPDMISRMVTSIAAKSLGAGLVNAASTTPRAVDLSILVGQNKDVVMRALAAYGIGTSNSLPAGTTAASTVTLKDVSSDSAWSNVTPESGAQYAPAAFEISQPLTVFYKGDLVVGFDATNPTDILNHKIADLQQQVTSLSKLVNQSTPGGPKVG
ncbi:MAG: hypothetical protein C5B50_17475 [Verrucomicrobia bacterium]|nr:MAG: hypothetical protein C5B50_17475 [Verrucomicrobiota bacterium]